jgi:hypothetical protein
VFACLECELSASPPTPTSSSRVVSFFFVVWHDDEDKRNNVSTRSAETIRLSQRIGIESNLDG